MQCAATLVSGHCPSYRMCFASIVQSELPSKYFTAREARSSGLITVLPLSTASSSRRLPWS